ncbi:acetyl-CoA carboxylase biotin carboxylase subunit, partial [bacterium]|nr:acetyl-CoA carboxylase biotin carboxylase subunit [bacterium]
GIPTVAVYSQADAKSLHVRLATDAFCIGPAQSSESYLNIPAIISTALMSGCDAIHPGYGFMSERADFVDICAKHGIKFIGPSSDSMQKMGDKATARKTMIENNVPVTPGTDIINSVADLKEFAKKAGYPIILTATAGGGGKGMRIVRSDDELESNMQLCQQEAEKFFGNPGIYAEKFLENPRHIEVQILADSFGNVIHLGERDCSIQRRHQKLLEEAPSPAIDEKTRQEMGAAAVRAAKAIKYEGAGTCEFLLDNDGKWYFMEMNTRVQVEHCVTEMISQVDIVREQIRVAAGKKLNYTQEDIILKGHAIECRINAEDSENGFMPCPGTIDAYLAPGGFGVRVDSHVYAGYKIPPYYDSMIGKLICWGRTRNEARRRMYQALKEYVVLGIKTTIPFHQQIVEDDVFISGEFNTGFIEDWYKRNGKEFK